MDSLKSVWETACKHSFYRGEPGPWTEGSQGRTTTTCHYNFIGRVLLGVAKEFGDRDGLRSLRYVVYISFSETAEAVRLSERWRHERSKDVQEPYTWQQRPG